MNKILIKIAFLIAVLICAFYAFNAYIYNEKQGDGTNVEIPVTTDTPRDDSTLTKMFDPNLEMEFSYPNGAEGYEIDGSNTRMSVDPDFVKGYILTRHVDVIPPTESDVPRDGPPTMQLRVYRNTLKQSPSVWAMEHPLESNIELAIGEEKEAVVGGANAVLYKADGLYASDVYVVAHDSKIYVFTGAYSDASSPLVTDFNNLITSVRFVTIVK